MIENKICPLCEENDVELMYSTLPGYQEPLTFEIYHCKSCNSSYNLPRGEPDSIYELIYENSEIAPGYHRYWKYSKDILNEKEPLNYLAEKEMTYWAARKAVFEYAEKNKNPRIIEIGSGLGYLTYAFRKAGFNITGLDISETAVAMAKEQYGDYYISDDLFKYSVKNAGLFDIVLLTEVIEHVDNVANFISALSNLLKPNGQIVMTTPNKSFYPIDAIWVSDAPPIHCWWFSEESIKYLSNILGMSVSFIDFSDFYKNNYTPMRLDVNRKISRRHSTFSEKGDLLKSKNNNIANNNLKAFFHSLVKLKIIKICHKELRICYLKLRYFGNPNIKSCGKQSHILCAVMKLKNVENGIF